MVKNIGNLIKKSKNESQWENEIHTFFKKLDFSTMGFSWVIYSQICAKFCEK